MKYVTLAALALAPSFAHAHGTLVGQASAAIASAGDLFAQAQPREIQRLVTGVSAVRTGHEQFTVTIALSNQAQFKYACVENEEVEPVRWECQAR